MKKGLKMTVAVLAAITLLSGCNKTAGNNTEQADGVAPGTATQDLYDSMTDGEAVTAADAKTAFDDAIDNIGTAKSAFISTEVNISLTESGTQTSSTNKTELSYQTVEAADDTTKSEESAETATGEDTASEDDTAEMIARVNVSSDYNGETNETDGYYEDGYLYYSMDDQKVKEAMGYDDLMYVVGNYSIQFTEDVIEEAHKQTDGDETKYIIKFDPEAMADMMSSNLESAGSALGEGEDMQINSAFMYYTVNADGVITGYDMELDAKFITASEETTVEDETGETATGDTSAETSVESPFVYSVVANFNDINSTTVEKLDGLDEYRDVNEVLEEMQSEQENTDEAEAEEITAE